jgi:hypothetical protein
LKYLNIAHKNDFSLLLKSKRLHAIALIPVDFHLEKLDYFDKIKKLLQKTQAMIFLTYQTFICPSFYSGGNQQ